MTVTVTDAKATAQEAEIRRLLAAGNPPHLVAAAVGCALARVQHIQANPAAGAPGPAPAPRAPSEPATRRAHHPTGPRELLALAARNADPRITALAAHIGADLDTLAALLDLAATREAAARALLAADRRAERLRADHAARHPNRRATDRQENP